MKSIIFCLLLTLCFDLFSQQTSRETQLRYRTLSKISLTWKNKFIEQPEVQAKLNSFNLARNFIKNEILIPINKRYEKMPYLDLPQDSAELETASNKFLQLFHDGLTVIIAESNARKMLQKRIARCKQNTASQEKQIQQQIDAAVKTALANQKLATSDTNSPNLQEKHTKKAQQKSNLKRNIFIFLGFILLIITIIRRRKK